MDSKTINQQPVRAFVMFFESVSDYFKDGNSELDADEFYRLGVEEGLLQTEAYDPARHGTEIEAAVNETIYVLTDETRDAIAALIKNYTTDPNVQELIRQGVPLTDILLIDCPYCGNECYYSGGFTCGCTWCGADIAQFSDDAHSVDDALYAAATDEYSQSHAVCTGID